ncbi:HNH endonuclease [Bacillus paranthracis]|uniref:HNH endonuclease n=1 Tax=Bacillus paranthracis TaxID=2026186 RepID=UPI003D22B16D
MPIPKNITEEHILKAIDYIDVHGVPERRHSTKFDLLFNGKLYPPKYVIARANVYANGEELREFSGGREANSFLEKLDLKILYPNDGISRNQYNRPSTYDEVLPRERDDINSSYIPDLEPSKRSREYNKYNNENKDSIFYEYLFNSKSHRWLDEHILDIATDTRTGHESMNILHYIGLKDKHKGIFKNYSVKEAIKTLEKLDSNFGLVIQCLKRLEQKSGYNTEFYSTVETLSELELLANEELKAVEITETEKEKVIKSRIGQSVFKKALLAIEKKCSLCGVSDERFLIASHIKPWSQSNHKERLDVNNGLLLCPNHDAVFDKGYISFNEDGRILISESLDEATKVFLNINKTMNVRMNEGKRQYMKWHRWNVYIRG